MPTPAAHSDALHNMQPSGWDPFECTAVSLYTYRLNLLTLQELLMPVVVDPDVKIDVAGFAALALGLVFASTCHGDSAEAIIQALMLRGELELGSPFAKFLALGLGLLFLGRQEAVEPTVEVSLLTGRVHR